MMRTLKFVELRLGRTFSLQDGTKLEKISPRPAAGYPICSVCDSPPSGYINATDGKDFYHVHHYEFVSIESAGITKGYLSEEGARHYGVPRPQAIEYGGLTPDGRYAVDVSFGNQPMIELVEARFIT